MTTQTLSEILANYAVSSNPAAVPDAVRHEVKRAFLNWVGCAIGGSPVDPMSQCIAVAKQLGSSGNSSVIGRCEKFDAARVAFLNSLSSSLYAYDDTHLKSIAHPTGPIGAACLAIAECTPAISGPTFLHALTMGLEVECRLGAYLMEPPAQCSVGWTMTGLVGGLGVAAALARLLPLSEKELVSAIGIAATRSSGLRGAGVGYMTRDFPMGYSGLIGVESALMAKAGVVSSPRALDKTTGLGGMVSQNANEAAALSDLGTRYELMNNAYKPYPAGIVGHSIIEVCIALASANDLDPKQIEKVEMKVNGDCIRIMGLADPIDMYGAQVSAKHWTAVSLIRRRAGIAEASTSAANDPQVRELRTKVHLIETQGIGRDGAVAVVHLKNGSILTEQVEHCIGSVDRPMSDAELETKFRTQAAGIVDDATTQRLIHFCWNFDSAVDVGDSYRRAAGA